MGRILLRDDIIVIWSFLNTCKTVKMTNEIPFDRITVLLTFEGQDHAISSIVAPIPLSVIASRWGFSIS